MKKMLGVAVCFACVLIGCSGADAPAPPGAGSGETQPQLPSPPSTTPTPNPNPNPGEVTTPTPNPTPTPIGEEEPTTCEGILALHAKPAAVFAIDKDKTTYAYKPVDVFAQERTTEYTTPNGVKHHIRTLSIALTDTAHECAFRKNGLAPTEMYEMRISISKDSPTAMPDEIKPGTYDDASASLGAEVEGGERCYVIPPGATEVGSVGTALHGGMATGTVTITKRTATSIEGLLDVSISTSSSNGQPSHLRMSFTAPICVAVAPQQACCVNK